MKKAVSAIGRCLRKRLSEATGTLTRSGWCRLEWQEMVGKQWLKSQTVNLKLKRNLVLLAMGFVHPVHIGMLVQELGVALDERGNIRAG
jgi:glutamate synthase (NADPH/NADH) small chain